MNLVHCKSKFVNFHFFFTDPDDSKDHPYFSLLIPSAHEH